MKLKCPICKNPVKIPEKIGIKPQWYPFCSERCKMIDLGKWLDSDYRIPSAPETEDDNESPEQHRK